MDLPPQLRELDARLEDIELRLRLTIDTALAGGLAQVPPHVLQKADERIQRAVQKNASLDAELYETLKGKLEFCDLRELQDIITNKSLWSYFQAAFANKDTLIAKFGQLAELRNGIRHSRTVDEITRKEGEAAILWFEQVLGRQA